LTSKEYLSMAPQYCVLLLLLLLEKATCINDACKSRFSALLSALLDPVGAASALPLGGGGVLALVALIAAVGGAVVEK
jgi:hypothetical protein